MDRTPAQLYRFYPEQTTKVIAQSLESGLRAGGGDGPLPVFFRADDIGVPSENFSTMMHLFGRKKVPLCLAVVPAWLTAKRWAAMAEICDTDSPLWCWHQHGWKHRNHEISGKKNEFGGGRPDAQIRADLSRGRKRLNAIMGRTFSAYFTPPWNRCSPAALEALADLDFHGLSRSRGSRPESQVLPDIAVNVDLHTRKEADSPSCLAALADEIEQAAGTGTIGFMLHHQRMNKEAFELLATLLDLVVQHPRLTPVTFSGCVRSM